MILQFFTSYLVESADGVLWEVDLYSIACHYLRLGEALKRAETTCSRLSFGWILGLRRVLKGCEA